MKAKKLFVAVSVLIVLSMALGACASSQVTQAPATQAPATEAPVATEAPAATEAPTGPTTANPLKSTYEFAFVIPGTNSQYWNQYAGTGVDNAVLDVEAKYGVKINVTLYGPTEEGSTDQYMSILESVIAKKPDAIITATMQPDGTAPIIADAAAQGIYVNLFSLGITGNEDSYGALYYCNQPEQGKLAAEEMVRQMNEKNIPLEGVVGMHLATLVPILVEKMEMFRTTMGELAPNIEVLDTVYNNNDAATAQANVENQISTYGDRFIGVFAGNNLSGDGTVLAVRNAGLQNKIITIAVDSDEQEIAGLIDGSLSGIIVQTPYAQAYNATLDAFEHIVNNYNPPSKLMNYPAGVVTLANMNEPDFAALLDPLTLKK